MNTTTNDLTISFTVDRSPEEVFDAINRVRDWWSGNIVGDTDRLGAEWVYVVADLHFVKVRTAELETGRRVVWEFVDSYIDLPPDVLVIEDKEEWTGTRVIFDITGSEDGTTVRFTHEGLTPDVECYDACKPGWTQYIGTSLPNLITSGTGAAQSWEGEKALDEIRQQSK